MDANLKKKLEIFAVNIRKETLKALGNLGFGHLGGSFSVADTLAVLYGEVMNVDPANPHMEDRDILACSKGHAGPAVYSALALRGFFEVDRLMTINKGGTTLPSHCDANLTPGVDLTTGSLGQGASLAVGTALGRKIDKKPGYTYLILGDGELQEGQVWEAVSFAAQQKLGNLVAFVDWNKKQLDGYMADINDFSNIEERFKAFAWDCVTVNGHDVEAIYQAVQAAKLDTERPTCIVLDTIKAYGCTFASEIEKNHHITISPEQLEEGLAELAQIEQMLERVDV